MSVEGASFTITGVDVEEELDNVPSEHDIVKKLDMEFATSFHVPSQTGKGNMTAMDFDPKKDHMRVFLRIRPFSEDETNKGENQVGKLMCDLLSKTFVCCNYLYICVMLFYH